MTSTTVRVSVTRLVPQIKCKEGFANWVRIWCQSAIFLVCCHKPPSPALHTFFTLSYDLFNNLVPFGPRVPSAIKVSPTSVKRSTFLKAIYDVLKLQYPTCSLLVNDIFKFYYFAAISERIEIFSQPMSTNVAPEHPLFTGLQVEGAKVDIPCFTQTKGKKKVVVPFTSLTELTQIDDLDVLPVSPPVFGPPLWCLLFFVGFHVPDQSFAPMWIVALIDLLPCDICRQHATLYLKGHTLVAVATAPFLLGLYNTIRQRQNQPPRKLKDMHGMVNEFFVKSSKPGGVGGVGVTHLSIRFRLHRGLQYTWLL